MKSRQVVINSVKLFVPSINVAYITESKSIIKPKDIEYAKKIKDTLKVLKLERKVNANGNLYINFPDENEPFHVQWYGGENDIICGYDESSNSDDQYAKSEVKGCIKKKNDYLVLFE